MESPCPLLELSHNSASLPVTTKSTISNTGLPSEHATNSCSGCLYVPVYTEKSIIVGLLDCGSCVNLLSQSLAQSLGLMGDIQKQSITLAGVSGTRVRALGIVVINLRIRNRSFREEFVVAEIVEECILGQQFLTRNSLQVDFGTKTLSGTNLNVKLIDKGERRSITYRACVEEEGMKEGSTVIKCQIRGSNTDSSYTVRDGSYTLKFAEELNLLVEETMDEPTVVKVEDGTLEIPLCLEGESIIFLPRNYALATLVPVEDSFAVTAKHSFSGDFDQERIKRLWELLEIEKKDHLTQQEKEELRGFVASFADIFALDRSELGKTDLVEHQILLTSDKPVRAPYRRVPLHLREECIKELEELLECGIIQHSNSGYNTPALVLKRKDKVRIILDFRELNKITDRSYCTVPALNTITAGCAGAKYFSSCDFKDGFLQIPLKTEHRKFTAFAIPGIGHFEFCRMPLGLCSSPGVFQSLMDRLLAGIPPNIASAFIDDLLAPAKTFSEALHNLNVVFERLRISKLRLSPQKCKLVAAKLKYCGVYLTNKGIEADQEKVAAVKEMPLPKTLKQVRCMVGAFSWFRNHIPNFADLAKGLTDCLKNSKEKYVMTPELEESVKALVVALTSPPILTFPDPERTMLVYTDASEVGIGGCIGHEIEGLFHPIAYSSRALSPTEQRWPSFKREFYALWYHVTKAWRYYLIGATFKCHVDMKAITQEGFLKHSNQAIMLRWFMDLSAYNFELNFKAGKQMDLPDCLSRLPREGGELFTWWTNDPAGDDAKKEVINVQTVTAETEKQPDAENTPAKTAPVADTVAADTDLDAGIVLKGESPDISEVSIQEKGKQDGKEGTFENPIPAARSEYMEKAQKESSNIQEIIKWVREKKRPDSSEGLTEELQWGYRYFQHLGCSDGVLHYKYYMSNSKKFVSLIVVPQEQITKVIQQHHDPDNTGHLGPKKTIHSIRNKYFFRGMGEVIRVYCSNCPLCLVYNQPFKRNPAAPMKQFISSRPNQHVAIDLVGPIKGKCPKKWILTMVCKFTRFVEAVPLPNATAPIIARALADTWVFKYGVPECIMSDRGANLTTATVIKELYNVLGIQKLQTTAYHPKGNGHVEVYNKILVATLRKIIGDLPGKWPEKTPMAVFALNNSVCKSTGFAPAALWFGREVRTPTDLVFGTTTTKYYAQGQHYASETYHNMRDVFDIVRANSLRTLAQHKLAHDKKKKFHHQYAVGERVLVYKPMPPTVNEFRKFKVGFSGPWVINKVLSDWTFVVKHENPKFTKEEVVHFDKLRLIEGDVRDTHWNKGQSEEITTDASPERKTKNDEDSSEEEDELEEEIQIHLPEEPHHMDNLPTQSDASDTEQSNHTGSVVVDSEIEFDREERDSPQEVADPVIEQVTDQEPEPELDPESEQEPDQETGDSSDNQPEDMSYLTCPGSDPECVTEVTESSEHESDTNAAEDSDSKDEEEPRYPLRSRM